MKHSRLTRSAGIGTAVLALATCLATSAADAGATPGIRPVAPPAGSASQPALPTAGTVAPGAAAALAAGQGISLSAAAARLAGQDVLAARSSRIEQALGARTGGSYLDSKGNLVVTTLDAAGDASVVRAGARPQRVHETTADLDGVVRRLDAMAKSAAGVGSLQGWYVDVVHNAVVVTETAGAHDARSAAVVADARRSGTTVRVQVAPASEAPRPTDYLVGGYAYLMPTNGRCSVGFTMLDSSNRDVVLTAGHCTKPTGNASRNGYVIGADRTSNYPGTDFGTFWNSYPTYWQPSPSVYTWQYGTYVTVKGYVATPLVGSQLCKSGSTTGWTCGTITARNQTVNYSGAVVSGLVRHNACVEPGDSGGSNVTSTGYALGMTSGASLTSAKKCLGGTNSVSWYQPIAPAMQANGLRLRIG